MLDRYAHTRPGGGAEADFARLGAHAAHGRRVTGRAGVVTPARDPGAYAAWYNTPRGAWIGRREAGVLLTLMGPASGRSLLDVGSGTGYFSQRFAQAGLAVTGIDPDPAMVRFASAQAGCVRYLEGDARSLPFADNSFDCCAAVTSLCFIDPPERALGEMWRVSRLGLVLGLLNRQSLLHLQKHDRGGYTGARWDTWAAVRRWIAQLAPPATGHRHRTAVLLPGGGRVARLAESLFGALLPWGGFLAVYVAKRTGRDESVNHPQVNRRS